MILACPHCQQKNRVEPVRLAQAPSCGVCHRPLLAGAPLNVDRASFKSLLQYSPMPVIADFWASWCKPCRLFAPTFAVAAQDEAGRVLFAKVDTEAETELAAELGIRSIPTLVLFKGGQEIERFSGVVPLGQLKWWLAQHLG
jgi:thioredoxin 2